MIPVVCRELGDARPASSIADLNYVYFYPDPRVPGSGFGTGLASLVTALNSDLDWLRGHTRYLSLALAWDERGRGVDRLLTGSGLTEANAWKLRRPSGAPDLTDLHRAFFAASEAAGAAHHTDARQAALEQRVMELEAALAARSSAGSRPAPKPRGTKIFISYRRATSQALAGRICDRLEKDFARDEVFFDVDAIPIGVNFKEHIRGSLERSAVLLAIIGEGWRIGSRSGRRWWQPWARPDEDHVRSEIEVAFELGVPILPVLVDRTPMPKPSQVPGSIAAVCDLNAAAVRSGRDFHSDMDVVCSNIRELRSQV